MAKTSRENLDTWFDLNLDIDSRTIYMGSMSKDYNDGESGVDNFMAEYFIKGMHILEGRGDKPITILMNNPGGDVYHGMAIYDAINTSPCEITINVYAYAMSMGSIILQAADRRIMFPNSRFMIHYGYNGQSNHTKIFEKWSDEGKKLNYQMEKIYIERMIEKESIEGSGTIGNALYEILKDQKQFDFPKTEVIKPKFSEDLNIMREELIPYVKDLLNFDTILTAQETVSIGLADEIFAKRVL
jgi:ATP-dependent protease ClpP protease subunit